MSLYQYIVTTCTFFAFHSHKIIHSLYIEFQDGMVLFSLVIGKRTNYYSWST